MAGETDRALGRVEASIDAIKETLDRMQVESRESRGKIYAKIEETDRTVAEIKSDVRKTANRIEDAESRLSALDKIREQIKGGAIVVSVIWAVIGASVVVFWKWIVAKFTGAAG